MLTLPHSLQVALDRGMEGRVVQLEFLAAFDRVSHRGVLYKVRSMRIGVQFLSIVSEFLSCIKQRVRLASKANALVDVVSGGAQ